jgi:hypothetical protein
MGEYVAHAKDMAGEDATLSDVPDVLAPDLRIVFVGINPGRVSAAARAHFANPRNDFWRLLADAGLTSRLLQPSEEQALLDNGIGITNAARRVTRGSGERCSALPSSWHCKAGPNAAHREAAGMANVRYEGGVTSYLEVLYNEQELFNAELGLAHARRDELLDRHANVALRALVTVVDRGIEHVDTGSQGARDRLCVSRVSCGVGIAEVCSQTNRREPQFARTRYVGGAAKVAGIA